MNVGDRALVGPDHPRLAGRLVRVRDLWGSGPVLASVQTVDRTNERPRHDWVAVNRLLPPTGGRPNDEGSVPRENKQENEHEQ